MVKSDRNQIEGLAVQPIINRLTVIRSRMYRQALQQTIIVTFFCGLILLAVLFVLNRMILLPIRLSTVSWIVMSVAVGVGVCLSIRHRKDLLFVARTVDEKMALRERLSTAFELMKTTPQNEFAQLQIRDAAEIMKTLDVAKISPYRVPKLLIAFPIPLVLIGLSFAIPLFYETPQPLTAFQEQVLNSASKELEDRQVKDPMLQKQIKDTVSKLKAATDLDTAQEHLSDLKKQIRQQKLEQIAIADAIEASESFRGMDTNQFAAELDALAEQNEIPPELQAELANLFQRLQANLLQSALNDSLNQVQGKAVTPEMLQDIIDALNEAESLTNLAQLEAQLAASQKDLALATIAPETSRGGIANSDGAPGQDAGSSEVQGTRESAMNSDTQLTSEATNTGKIENEVDGENSTPPLTGEATQTPQIGGEQLTLTAETSGSAESFSNVFAGETRDGTPTYLPFSDVVLNAERAYAEAVNNNRIPVRYQTQIKAYLEAISRKNEK